MDNECINRLKASEDNYTERKPNGAKPSELRETAVAFANSLPQEKTGILFIGIDNRGEIQGVDDPDSYQKKIKREFENKIYPPLKSWKSEVLSFNGKHVICIEVKRSDNRPHFSGNAYVREGSQNTPASKALFDEMITMRLSKPYEILKWKNKEITVVTLKKKLGKSKLLNPRDRFVYNCRIEDCNAQFVTLFDIDSDQQATEPLENILIQMDDRRKRLQLIVQFPE